MSTSPRNGPRRVARLVVVPAVLAVHAGLLAWSGYRHSPAGDEPAHLVSGICHLTTGRFDLYQVNPPLVRSLAALPVFLDRPNTDWTGYRGLGNRPEWALGRRFINLNGEKSFWYFALARWALIPLSLLGGYVCYRWAGELFGAPAGLLALVLWCFCPNIIANSSMITPDGGATALGVTAGYTFWRWLREPGWKRAGLAGLALGAAELAKATWLVLFALWPLLWLVYRGARFRSLPGADPRRHLAQLGLVLGLGLYVLNLGYGFEGTCTRLGDFVFVSDTLAGAPGPGRTHRNRFADTPLAGVPVPLPQNYVRGIDVQKRDFEARAWSYLRGVYQRGGWWYYYLYCFGVKVPLGTLGLGLLAVFLTVRGRGNAGWRDELVLLLPPVLIVTVVSAETGFNRYFRYVLPAFPFLFVWLSKVASPAVWRRPFGAWLVGGLAAWSVASSLLVYPHSLSYFNELAGGPLGGPNHLLDANVEWGQDLLELKSWLDRHPEARPIHLDCVAFFDPRDAGIEFKPLDPSPGPPKPGWYAIGACGLRGYGQAEGHRAFLSLPPFDRIGYSIFIYHVEPAGPREVDNEQGIK